jgi:hypothetical protein
MSTYDPLDTAEQERSADDAKLRAKIERESEEADVRWLMGSKRGRRILWRLMDQSGVFRLSFNTNSMQMAFAEGNRNMGNKLLAKIHTLCPELYPQMVKENTQGSST